MIDWTKTARAACLLAGSVAGSATTDAQLANGQVRSRGVMVIRPTAPAATPTPAPVVEPVAPAPPRPAPLPVAIIKSCPRPFARPDVALDAGAAFNRRLKALLATRRASVVVDLPTPYVVDAAPPAPLTPWLGEVRASGGLVRVDSYCQASRGMFGFLRKMLAGGGDTRPYAAASGYDAVLHVDGVDQRVTQVEFALRSVK